MKKIIILFFIALSANSYAQMTREEVKAALFAEPTVENYRKRNPNACHVYKSSDDYYINKPIENMDWQPWKSGTSKFTIIRNGQVEKTKVTELSDLWFSNEQGFLMRYFEKNFYTVVVDDAICYYIQFGYGEVSKSSDSTFSFSTTMSTGKYFEFYSETLKGDIKEWSDKVFETYLKQFNLLEQYENEKIKREMKDSVWGYETKKINKKLKYLKIISTKLSNKN